MSIIKVFNSHFLEFIEDIQRVFPEDKNIRPAKLFISNMNRVNPKLVIKYWKQYIADPYGDNIEVGEFSFFLEKDYSEDVGTSDKYDGPGLLNIIELIRVKIRKMEEGNRLKTVKYIQNLTKLSIFYFNTCP